MADTAVGVAPPGGSQPVAWAAVATASLEERARPQVSPERATEAAQEAESSAESSPVEVVAVPASSRGKKGGGKSRGKKGGVPVPTPPRHSPVFETVTSDTEEPELEQAEAEALEMERAAAAVAAAEAAAAAVAAEAEGSTPTAPPSSSLR